VKLNALLRTAAMRSTSPVPTVAIARELTHTDKATNMNIRHDTSSFDKGTANAGLATSVKPVDRGEFRIYSTLQPQTCAAQFILFVMFDCLQTFVNEGLDDLGLGRVDASRNTDTSAFWAPVRGHASMVLVILVLLLALLLYYRAKRSSGSLLPPTVSAARSNAASAPWTWETSALNLPHDALTEYLASASRADGAIPRGLVAFYDAGTLVGLGAMLASVGLLLWTLYTIARDLLALAVLRPTSPVTTSVNRLISRALSPSTTASTAPSSELSLQLLIPGLTTPLSHAPLLILALLLAQAFHEFGHALSATLPPTPAALHRIGISLRGAYVALIPHHRATPWASMRIACAGAWHNVVLGLTLWMAAKAGMDSLMRSTLFPRVQGDGLVVFDVERVGSTGSSGWSG